MNYDYISSKQNKDTFEDLYITVLDKQSTAEPRPKAALSASSGQPSGKTLSEMCVELLMACSVLGSYWVQFLRALVQQSCLLVLRVPKFPAVPALPRSVSILSGTTFQSYPHYPDQWVIYRFLHRCKVSKLPALPRLVGNLSFPVQVHGDGINPYRSW